MVSLKALEKALAKSHDVPGWCGPASRWLVHVLIEVRFQVSVDDAASEKMGGDEPTWIVVTTSKPCL